MEKTRVEFEVGKSYEIKIPGAIGLREIYIESILPNTIYQSLDEEIDNAEDMIVYRTWVNHKASWYWEVRAYWELCIFNDWNYKK
jgi:hypothetical protein